MAFENLMNPVLSPLLELPVFWAVVIIAFVIALLITLVYRWMTDQHLMKKLKEDMKSFQKEMKELKDHPQKFMEVQKKAMETNMKYMMHSLKPTIITILPILLIFGWLNANLAYEPINPGQEFATQAIFEQDTSGTIVLKVPEGVKLASEAEQKISCNTEKGLIFSSEVCRAEWDLSGESGEYLLEYSFNDKVYKKELLITQEKGYAEPEKKIDDSEIEMLKIGHEKLTPIQGIGLGWLGTYIAFSIIFSMSLRKILKIH